mmetsp:Transcript_19806/g.48624  ORF Transcript_19806/g.48624 Transcript_19806/m.48624 type:complete len:358 (+) Transcript_19806:50-1123(+)
MPGEFDDKFPVYTGANNSGTVSRISAHDITPEEFETQYINKGLPVVLTDLMDDWPAWREGERKWTFDFFKKEYGTVPCTVDTEGRKEDMTLAQYLSRFDDYANLPKGSPIPYLRTWYFEDDIPELAEDFRPPPHFHHDDAFMKLPKELRPPFQWLFFGPAGTESKLHVDVWQTDAWLGMLEGSKTFTLFHPAHRKHIEVSENEWPDLLSPPDAARFPDQHKAVPAQTLLRAGEVLYIPRKWPHHAVAQSNSISLTLNFAPVCTKDNVLKHLVPYAKNRGRCQLLLQRPLRARDNLMQLCIHGGTIKYADIAQLTGGSKEEEDVPSRNPMQGSKKEAPKGDVSVDNNKGADEETEAQS